MRKLYYKLKKKRTTSLGVWYMTLQLLRVFEFFSDSEYFIKTNMLLIWDVKNGKVYEKVKGLYM